MKWSVFPTLVIVASIPVLIPIMAGGCHTEVAKRASPSVPIVIELRPYLGGLRTLPVVVAGDTLEFLLDTGAGASVIDSAVAPLVRCAPSGRIGGHRSNGGWIECRECPSVDIEIPTAVQIFELNVEAFPEAWNPWDSLGEAYLEAGDRERAIASYHRSLELNPDNGNARQVLTERLGVEVAR